ncbi:monothiol bacilliredoxin BrxC family protein [Meiothermus granaticius]|jgi:bacillithiol system protein YtxJ|uniref:Bacillithiol system protein YtxJ n=1 Tax=Meiothermus granaticius NBRC 107808 TaxID=1227551 RepID=A0A399F5R7_9DEIN|nr:monothiol bacilliredoxin BrxC family protein [Meiothermus granaticius]MCL6525929.1 thioredoxin family protein [Thermaceae bacterium]RIH91578.1 bacillithiol system protein YtxJ [Meiothermus granaticius NBRC 107808]GEM85437.1 thioredoxin [Meiothermus granaticius NBRC 107808]
MSLRERIFDLHTPESVDRFLETYPLAAIFKASTSDRTFEAWGFVERAIENRTDLALGLIRIPEDRPASNWVEERSGVRHQSPQFILFRNGKPVFDLDNREIEPERLSQLLAESLPVHLGAAVKNPAVVGLHVYADLLRRFVQGNLSEERFQWGYLDQLKKEAGWRSEADFELLNSLFENPDGRAFRPATLVALEFQSQLAGRGRPLLERARALLARLEAQA